MPPDNRRAGRTRRLPTLFHEWSLREFDHLRTEARNDRFALFCFNPNRLNSNVASACSARLLSVIYIYMLVTTTNKLFEEMP